MDRYAVFYTNDDGDLVQFSIWLNYEEAIEFYKDGEDVPNMLILKDVTPNKEQL